MADWTPQSRAEEILFKTINGEPYDGLPQSRIEELLLELKDAIESGGGGGGGTDNYNLLKNLPQINGQTVKGNISGTTLGLVNMVMGKDLSTNDYTNADKAIVNSVTSALSGKVDKVTGKGLSTNDYADTDKAIVDGVTTALAGKVSTSSVGSANGVAELDANGRVPSAQLPSYVDDVLEYADLAHFPATGETGKIYIAEDTNKTYRWSGSDYAEISESLALGETSSTAYAGNKGKDNADAIAAIKDGANIDSFGDVETALAGKANSSDLGNKSNLTTTDKSSAVAAINELDGKIGNLSTGRLRFYPIVAQNDTAAVSPTKANSYSIVSLTILGNSTEIPEATGGVTDGYTITAESATYGYLHIKLVGSYASVNKGNCLNLVLDIT